MKKFIFLISMCISLFANTYTTTPNGTLSNGMQIYYSISSFSSDTFGSGVLLSLETRENNTTKNVEDDNSSDGEDNTHPSGSDNENNITMGETQVVIDGDTSTQNTSYTKLNGNNFVVKVISKIPSSSIVINGDGTRTTTASIVSSNIETKVNIKENGTIENIFKKDEKSTLVNIEIVGTNTTINENGSMQIKIPIINTDDEKVINIDISVDENGTVQPQIIVNDQNITMPIFEVGSEVKVKIIDGKVFVEVKTSMNEKLEFKRNN